MIIGNDIVDLAPLFEAFPRRNYLLNALNIFETSLVNTPKVLVSDIQQSNYSLLNEAMSRYSSAHNVTARVAAIDRLIELPWYPREDSFKAADIQGKRKAGTSIEETITDLSAEYVGKHQVAFMRTREKAFAQSLFAGQVSTPATSDVLIDWASVFGQEQLTASISLTSTTANPFQALETLVSQIEDKSDGLVGAIERVVVFATSDFYSALRYSPVVADVFKYVSPLDPRNIVFAQASLLPGVATFDVPGTAITVVKVTDPLLAQFLPASGAVMVPVFAQGTQIYQSISGCASGSLDLLNASPAEYYAWAYKSERGSEYNVISEHSLLPVNHGIGLSVKITQSA